MAEGIATRSSRGHRTICLPIKEEDYLRVIHDPKAFRHTLDDCFRQTPELFPVNFALGYELKDDRKSAKQQIPIRRILLKDDSAYSIRPSFLMPYMTAHTADVEGPLDVIRNKGYNSRMMTYATLQSDRREFLALTGLTFQEFQLLLNAFTPAYERRYPKDRTLADRPRQRCAGGGRKGVLDCPEQKLLFLLVYLKTYPLQVLMGELFSLSQPGVNYWIHRLLPVLRDALDSLSVLPERNPNDFARSQTATGTEPRLIIDGTERRRQRPKSPEKQALHYSGKKKAHTDKNVVIVDLRRKCIGFLSRTYVGKTHDKKIADSEGISYPPKAELYKDTGFQGYEPAVTRTCQAKKKAAPRGTHSR